MTDSIHKIAEYIDHSDEYSCVCLVKNEIDGTEMTGVLIKPDIVLTCAHGIKKNRNYKIVFLKNKKKIMVFSDIAHIDKRYSQFGGKFDLALLRLSRKIKEIKPAKIINSIKLSLPLTVISFTNNVKKKFFLCELDKFSNQDSFEYERNLFFSSLFFHPSNTLPENASEEIKIRQKDAFNNWEKHHKLPYALALPGTSGAPVFVKYKYDLFLFGVVTSYSHLYQKTLQPINPDNAFCYYQTIFIPLYKQQDDYEPLKAKYIIDKKFLNLIKYCPKPSSSSVFKKCYEFFTILYNNICRFFKQSIFSTKN